jgi:hypothetical protein
MLLGLPNAVFLGSESLGTRDRILLSQIWDFPFRRLLRLVGSRWRYSNPPPHGFCLSRSSCLQDNHSARTSRKTVASLLRVRWSRRHVATDGESVSKSWCRAPYLGLMTGYLILFDSYGLVFVGRLLWREDGSVFCICCWPLPAQSFSRPYFTVSDLRLPFSSPPTTRRVTVEVFDPTSVRFSGIGFNDELLWEQ